VLSRDHSGRPAGASHRAGVRTRTPHPTPGLPRFVIAATPGEFKVIDTYTWTTVAKVPAPAGQTFAKVAGAADDQTFVLAAQKPQQSSCSAWLYELHLSNQGRPGSLSLLSSDMSGLPTSIAISADASTVAYSFVHCATGSGTLASSTPIGDITVMKLASKQVKQWSYDLGEDYTSDLSLSADGSLLGFSSYLDAPNNGSTIPPSVGRVLPTSTQPGTVAQRGKVLFQLTPANGTDSGQVTLSADGRTMYAFQGAAGTLTAYDASSGKRIRVLTTTRDPGYSLTASPAGGYLLLAAAPAGSRPSKVTSSKVTPSKVTPSKVTMSWIDLTTGAITKLPISLPASTGSDAQPTLGL
jgi:hypothetical protein